MLDENWIKTIKKAITAKSRAAKVVANLNQAGNRDYGRSVDKNGQAATLHSIGRDKKQHADYYSAKSDRAGNKATELRRRMNSRYQRADNLGKRFNLPGYQTEEKIVPYSPTKSQFAVAKLVAKNKDEKKPMKNKPQLDENFSSAITRIGKQSLDEDEMTRKLKAWSRKNLSRGSRAQTLAKQSNSLYKKQTADWRQSRKDEEDARKTGKSISTKIGRARKYTDSPKAQKEVATLTNDRDTNKAKISNILKKGELSWRNSRKNYHRSWRLGNIQEDDHDYEMQALDESILRKIKRALRALTASRIDQNTNPRQTARKMMDASMNRYIQQQLETDHTKRLTKRNKTMH